MSVYLYTYIYIHIYVYIYIYTLIIHLNLFVCGTCVHYWRARLFHLSLFGIEPLLVAN